MKKEDQLIMAIKKEELFEKDYFQGFLSADKVDFQKRILDNYQYIRRGDIERDFNYKQPIGYVVLIDKEEKKVFAYQRSIKDKDYTEKRLRGKWSLGIGGHVDKEDKSRNKENPIEGGTLREAEEEVAVKRGEMKIAGYINDDLDDVGRAHFGILYLLEVFGDVVGKGAEIKTGKMMKREEVNEIIKNPDYILENWAKISWPFLEEFL